MSNHTESQCFVQGYSSLLRRRPAYLNLWIAQAVSLLGDWFTTIALSTVVARNSGGSGLAVGALVLARFVPAMLIGPLAGVLVDRMNRKRLLIISDVVRVFVVLGFLFAGSPDRLWLIYVLSVIQFSFSSLFEPCRSALIPSLVSADELVVANTLGSVTWSVMLAVGAVVGGAVTALVGPALALLIDSSTFAISALLITSITVPPKVSVAGAPAQSPVSGLRGLTDGLRYLQAHPETVAVLLVKVGGSVGNVDLIMVIYATQLFVLGQNGTGSLGLLYAAFGIGALLGPLLLNPFSDGSVRRLNRLIIVGFALITLGWFLIAGAPILGLVVVAITIKAMGSAIYWTYSSVIIQKTVPDHFLGRVFSLDQAGFQFSTVVSASVIGLLIDYAGRASGIHIGTALRLLYTGQLSYQAAEPQIRAIVFGTGIASLVPLALWFVVIAWIERRNRNV